MTYALNEAGIYILGGDLSSDAVFMAKSAFGDLYLHQELKNIQKKFDLINVTELIEQLSNLTEFLLEIKNLLKKQTDDIYNTKEEPRRI